MHFSAIHSDAKIGDTVQVPPVALRARFQVPHVRPHPHTHTPTPPQPPPPNPPISKTKERACGGLNSYFTGGQWAISELPSA